MTRFPLSRLAWAAIAVSAGGLAACSASAEDDETLGSTSQATTASGKAKEGQTCLVNPYYRKDKCAPSLTCATQPGATQGKCVARHGESEACDPTYGGADCATNLTCTAKPSGGGFCKGAGAGACKTTNGGLDCASGRVCVSNVLGGVDGTCQTTGGEGTSCDPNLVANGCGNGLECVEVPGSTSGVCTNVERL